MNETNEIKTRQYIEYNGKVLFATNIISINLNKKCKVLSSKCQPDSLPQVPHSQDSKLAYHK